MADLVRQAILRYPLEPYNADNPDHRDHQTEFIEVSDFDRFKGYVMDYSTRLQKTSRVRLSVQQVARDARARVAFAQWSVRTPTLEGGVQPAADGHQTDVLDPKKATVVPFNIQYNMGRRESKFEAEQCTFCCELLEGKETCWTEPCEHRFHCECIEIMFGPNSTVRRRCPFCDFPNFEMRHVVWGAMELSAYLARQKEYVLASNVYLEAADRADLGRAEQALREAEDEFEVDAAVIARVTAARDAVLDRRKTRTSDLATNNEQVSEIAREVQVSRTDLAEKAHVFEMDAAAKERQVNRLKDAEGDLRQNLVLARESMVKEQEAKRAAEEKAKDLQRQNDQLAQYATMPDENTTTLTAGQNDFGLRAIGEAQESHGLTLEGILGTYILTSSADELTHYITTTAVQKNTRRTQDIATDEGYPLVLRMVPTTLERDVRDLHIEPLFLIVRAPPTERGIWSWGDRQANDASSMYKHPRYAYSAYRVVSDVPEVTALAVDHLEGRGQKRGRAANQGAWALSKIQTTVYAFRVDPGAWKVTSAVVGADFSVLDGAIDAMPPAYSDYLGLWLRVLMSSTSREADGPLQLNFALIRTGVWGNLDRNGLAALPWKDVHARNADGPTTIKVMSRKHAVNAHRIESNGDRGTIRPGLNTTKAVQLAEIANHNHNDGLMGADGPM